MRIYLFCIGMKIRRGNQKAVEEAEANSILALRFLLGQCLMEPSSSLRSQIYHVFSANILRIQGVQSTAGVQPDSKLYMCVQGV